MKEIDYQFDSDPEGEYWTIRDGGSLGAWEPRLPDNAAYLDRIAHRINRNLNRPRSGMAEPIGGEMKFFWNAEVMAPDGHYQIGGTLYADDLTAVVDQVNRGIQEDWSRIPMYTGQRITLKVNVENLPTQPG